MARVRFLFRTAASRSTSSVFAGSSHFVYGSQSALAKELIAKVSDAYRQPDIEYINIISVELLRVARVFFFVRVCGVLVRQ